MMGNVIEGGVIGTAPAPYPLTATHLSATTVSPKTPISTAATAETVVDSSVDDGELCESTESSKARVQAKSVRSKSLESLTIPSDQSQSSTLKHPDATKKSNSMSSEVLDKPEEFQLTIREFLNKFKLSISLGGKQNDGQSAEPPKEDKTTENELEKPDDTSSTEGQKCPDSVSASLASVSVESYHTASESTEESTSEDLKNKNLSRNPSVFSLQPDVENEIARISPNVVPENADIASGFKPKSDLLPTDDSTIVRTRSGRQLLGRAFSCEGSGIRCVGGNYPSPNEDSDTSESDKDRSNPQMDLAESINELYIAESDEEDRTLVVDEGVTKGAREGSDDDDIGKCCEGDTFPDDRIKVKDQDRVNLARKSSSSSGNEACRRSTDKTGLVVEKVLGQSLVTNLTDSQDSQDEEEVTEKPFGVDALNVDPSSAASEQVLENLISSSSGQPSFDDPDLTETSVFVFPDGKPGSDQAERVREILEEIDFDEDSIEKLPKSPLVRSGSRIIDKKTKTIRGRPKSCHSSTFQTGIKEEIFTEMGFAQDRHDSGREEQSDLVVTPKPRVPFKSMQVQSLVEMPEEEGEVNFEKSRTYASKSVSCRPKSFPSAGFFEGTDSVDLNLNPEVVKKMPDILNKSCESGYVSGSYSQSPPLRSLTATPSLTMPSGLTQPKLSSQTLQSAEVDHFVITCRNESTRKIDEHANLEKFKAVLRREPQGYGMRTGGNKPVLILSVVEGSVAARHGLKARDVIFMLNGTNVSQYDHESVLSFFKASRSHLEIVVLRQVDHKGEAQKSIGNQIEYLKTHPALMACLLLDLTLQNKQNSLFFSMAAYLLRQKDACDSNFQRWSYEIFSTFLDQHAPLKLQHGLEVPSISGLLSSDEESIRRSYDSVDQFLQPVIKKQLSDYLKNKGLVHEFELTNMDHLKQMKYIEKVLWKSFETLSSEEKDDKKQALAASMATFFHLVGFSSIRGGNLLESFPSFVSNKIPSKLKKSKGHLFRTEYITNMSPCGVCKQPTWNLGTTVYKCSSCSFHIHSYCLFKLTEACNFKRKTNSFAPFYVEDPNSSFDLSKSYAGLFRSRSCQLSCKSAFIGDPDLDIPLDLPHLKDVIPHEDLKKLKNKELKFQEIVNELFHTEKLHLRSLKIMKMLYERPMRAEPTISNITNLLFPNLDELIRVHDQLNVEFEKCKEEQRVVTRIGGLLVSLLSGLRGDQLKRASAIFCKDQSYSLFALRKNLRKEKLTQIIQEAALNPYSGRLSLKDFLPKEMQRITKYPLLIDSLVNNSPANSEEHTKLVEASKLSRNILRYVDTQVRDCENGRKLMDLQLRLDARQLENSTDPNVIPYRKLNLTRKKLIMDGELAWKYKRAGGSKTQNLHVVLCEDILLLLVKQEERLVLKCHTTTIEDHVYVYYPVLQLSGLLAKDAGRDKCAFFIVDRNSPQVYHLAAKNKELRNRWFNTLTETVNNLARSAPVVVSTVLPKISPKSVFPSSASANQIHDKSSERSLVENDRHMGSSTSEFKGGVMTSQPCPRRDSAPSLVGSIKRKLPMAPSRSFDVGMTVEDERR